MSRKVREVAVIRFQVKKNSEGCVSWAKSANFVSVEKIFLRDGAEIS